MRTLSKGSRGADVTALQHALNARPYIHLIEDGEFGGKTESAVREFQQRVRLKADGIYGPQTDVLLWTRVLEAQALFAAPLQNSAAVSASATGTRPLSPLPKTPVPPASLKAPSTAGIVQQVSLGGQVALAPWLLRPAPAPNTPGGPIWSGVVSYALVYRTASSGPHVELALNPQLLVNSRVQGTDPRWGMQVNGQVTFADLVAPGRFHLVSPFLQATAAAALTPGVGFGGGFAIGNQVSFDLIPDRLQINLQGNVAAQWNNIGKPGASFSVLGQGAIGATVQF